MYKWSKCKIFFLEALIKEKKSIIKNYKIIFLFKSFEVVIKLVVCKSI